MSSLFIFEIKYSFDDLLKCTYNCYVLCGRVVLVCQLKNICSMAYVIFFLFFSSMFDCLKDVKSSIYFISRYHNVEHKTFIYKMF